MIYHVVRHRGRLQKSKFRDVAIAAFESTQKMKHGNDFSHMDFQGKEVQSVKIKLILACIFLFL